MLTNTGNHNKVNGFFDGYYGREIDENASEEYLEAYERGRVCAETEKLNGAFSNG